MSTARAAVRIIGKDRKCTRCGLAHTEIACPSSLTPTFLRPSDSPYRRQNEQYLFKFFIEVVGAAVSRSNISAYYWLGAFPQIAYETSSVRDTLLAAAAAFHQASGDVFVQTPPSVGLDSLVYEGRAMRALSQGCPSTHEVLSTSMAFWISSLCVGNWKISLQHLYHSLKIISALKDPSKYDQMHLRYQAGLAKVGLAYFRTTRGPCKKHGPGDFLNCDAECYTPEEKPYAHRVADSLHHLQAALPSFEMCMDLLQTRMDPHSHQAELETMLRKQIGEVRFLIASFSDFKRYGIKPKEWSEGREVAPYTDSAFDAVLSDLLRYIVNDQYSTGLAFQELELRTRVTIPNLIAATARGHYRMIQDSIALVLHGGYTEGLLKVKGNLRYHSDHVHHLLNNLTETPLADSIQAPIESPQSAI